jgi:thiol-disulfide isomerase/thioredoxin
MNFRLFPGKRAIPLIGALILLGTTPAWANSPFLDLLTVDGERLDEGPAVGNGKWTLVMIWATDCPICKQQKPVISAFHDKHKDVDAAVFGIALDGRPGLQEVRDYLDEHVVSFPNYVGEYPVIAINYQELTEEDLRGTPTYLLFDPEGELQGNNPGPISVEAIERFIERHDN